jgi:putative tryptophan/tyrosine transport system substrate-binding protein
MLPTMNRRHLITLLGGAAAFPLAAHAQQKAMPVIGFLSIAATGKQTAPFVSAFRQGLGEFGYIEGQNVAIESRWADGRYDRLPALAADLARREVDMIAAVSGDATIRAATDASSTIPVIFITGSDPVGSGLVASLARPGGHLTGISIITTQLTSKRFELLSELVPNASTIALLLNPNTSSTAERPVLDMQEAANANGIQLVILKAATEAEIEVAFATLLQLHASALVVGTDAFFNSRREQLVALAARNAIPAIYEWREFVAAGGLISYGASLAGVYRQLGMYAGKILKGAKPADLPVQQPDTFELVVNLKTAGELGLTVPQSILARADEVIE